MFHLSISLILLNWLSSVQLILQKIRYVRYMNTLQDIVKEISAAAGEKGISVSELARRSGLSRASVIRAMSGQENFTINSLLAMSEVLSLSVMLVPKSLSDGLQRSAARAQAIPSVVSKIRDL